MFGTKPKPMKFSADVRACPLDAHGIACGRATNSETGEQLHVVMLKLRAATRWGHRSFDTCMPGEIALQLSDHLRAYGEWAMGTRAEKDLPNCAP